MTDGVAGNLRKVTYRPHDCPVDYYAFSAELFLLRQFLGHSGPYPGVCAELTFPGCSGRIILGAPSVG